MSVLARFLYGVCMPTFLLATAVAWAQPVQVEIQGLEEAELNNARLALSLLRPPQDRPLTETEVQQRHRAAPSEIGEALRPFGYYSASIESELIRTESGEWRARYVVQTGPPILLRQVTIEIVGPGKSEPALQALVQKAPQPGERLLHARYDSFKQSLLRLATENGYLDARWSRHVLRVDTVRQVADVDLVMDTGPRFQFGEIRIAQDVLHPEVFARYVTLKPGQPFDSSELLKTQFALSDAGYFEQVEVSLDREGEVDGRVPVVVRAVARKRARYTAGVGYGTDTGPRLSLGTELRWVNARGHRLRGDLRLSALKSTLSSQYLIPIGDINRDYLALSANVQDSTDLGDGDSRGYTLGLSRNQPWRGWERSLYLNLERETFTFGDATEQTSLLIPGIKLTREQLDDALFPRRGWSLLVDLHGASSALLSDVSFLQMHAALRTVFPLGENLRLLLRGEAGTSAVDRISELPATQRFYAGGDQSVRGYRYQSIGPTNAQGLVIGGEHLLAGSIEADWFFNGPWGAAMFFDVGGASNSSDFDFARGAGFGLRWRSPIGMVRVDLAHPLDDDAPDVRLHLTLGTGL
jgi:translocation and assembly module TamA